MSSVLNTCAVHPSGPEPQNCMHCGILINLQERGIIPVAPVARMYDFIYPETLAGPTFSDLESLGQEGYSFPHAPTASVYSNTMNLAGPTFPFPQVSPAWSPEVIQPFPTTTSSSSIITRAYHPPVQGIPEHDHYPERFALSPDELMVPYAGPHYSDLFALDEEDVVDLVPLDDPVRTTVKPPSRRTPIGHEKIEKKQSANKILTDLEPAEVVMARFERGHPALVPSRARKQTERHAVRRVSHEAVKPTRKKRKLNGSSSSASDTIIVEDPPLRKRKKATRNAPIPIRRPRRSTRREINYAE